MIWITKLEEAMRLLRELVDLTRQIRDEMKHDRTHQ